VCGVPLKVGSAHDWPPISGSFLTHARTDRYLPYPSLHQIAYNRFPSDLPLAQMKVFGFSPLVLGEQPDCPSLRTLRGYFQIKLPQRAGRIVWLLLPFPLLPSSLIYLFGGGLVDPRMRASDEHILIVRVPRAGGRPGLPLPCLSWLDYFPSREGGLLGLPLRASNEHIHLR
jgi:hypothetical protein